MTTIFPWQETIWQSIWQRFQAERLPHALLFSGREGVGKMQFAQTLAASLLCKNPQQTGHACGQCQSCHLLIAASHPDFIQVMPEEKSQIIKIDQIRDVVDFVNVTALLGGYRVIVINPASAMNHYAANALLKTLEEPTPKTLLILVCDHGRRLPATITSRCQRIHFPKPPQNMALEWLAAQCSRTEAKAMTKTDYEFVLQLADGAPLKAQRYFENDVLKVRQEIYQGLFDILAKKADPLKTAATWQEHHLQTVMHWFLLWLNDLLRCKVTQGQASLINSDLHAQMQGVMQRISVEKLMGFIPLAQQTYARTLGTLNLNRQLLLEEILIEYSLCF